MTPYRVSVLYAVAKDVEPDGAVGCRTANRRSGAFFGEPVYKILFGGLRTAFAESPRWYLTLSIWPFKSIWFLTPHGCGCFLCSANPCGHRALLFNQTTGPCQGSVLCAVASDASQIVHWGCLEPTPRGGHAVRTRRHADFLRGLLWRVRHTGPASDVEYTAS